MYFSTLKLYFYEFLVIKTEKTDIRSPDQKGAEGGEKETNSFFYFSPPFLEDLEI